MISYHSFMESSPVPVALIKEAEVLHSQGFLFVDVFPFHAPEVFSSMLDVSENMGVLYSHCEAPSLHTASTDAAIRNYDSIEKQAEENYAEVELARNTYPLECDSANSANISYYSRLEEEARAKVFSTMRYSAGQKSRLGAYVTMRKGKVFSVVGVARC